ncbi:MAG: ABC transporter ATP-binding protein/permease [Clostridiales bacterium]|nr:ABC transporter ATP-binding protein/permease [Clostridiales bacterium]
MLQLKNITKDYVVTNELIVHALKDVSLNFRANEFVSILGPSGCGKTTLLNIVGGLDRYTEGDLVINGKSTKGFRDNDWDAYRNRSIGFVFQSYNLIPHMNVLDNVSLSLSLAGRSKAERIERAKKALVKVGLGDQLKKRPNQLSGGQMQRVAIARAIVNDPDIILADEPTGALDTETGVQVMELLKEISNDRLVIMVTHNQELADRYSTRIVRLLDGELVSDTNPYSDEELANDSKATADEQSQVAAATVDAPTKSRRKKVGMSLFTAFSISAKNLWTKKGRMLLTSFAGSIGIFGIALVLAISAGMSGYIDYIQTEAIGDDAITIGEKAYSMQRILSIMEDEGGIGQAAYPDIDYVIPYQRESFSTTTTLTDTFLDYVDEIDRTQVKALNYTYNVNMHVLQESDGKYSLRSSWATYANQMIEEMELIEDNYDVLYKSESSETGYPSDMTEVSLVVDKFNRITPSTLSAIGITTVKNSDGSYNPVTYDEIFEKGEYVIVLNDGWYVNNGDGTFRTITNSEYGSIKEENTLKVKIVSILRAKNNSSTLWLNSGLAYLPELAKFMVNDATNSEIGQAQLATLDKNVLTGAAFKKLPDNAKNADGTYVTDEQKLDYLMSQQVAALKTLGAYAVPTTIKIYPNDIDSRNYIIDYLEAWNYAHPDEEVVYLDITGLALSMLSTFIDVVTYVLVAFSAVSLIVSTVMISVITYTSVIERTKEIGVLRSIGARKFDIASIFNSETAIIGTLSGVLGVAFALILGAAINGVVKLLLGVSTIVLFSAPIILGMLALSIGLMLIAGLIPSRIAAKKDPVACLRSE